MPFKPQYFILLFLTFLGLTACQSQQPNTELTGYIEAELRMVAAPQAGWITEQSIKEGDVVTEQQLLFKLDQVSQLAQAEQAEQNLRAAEARLQDLQKGARPEEVKALSSQLQEAQAKLALAEKEVVRIQALVSKGLTTQEQLDRAQTDVAVSQAQVKTIEQNIQVAGLGGRIDALIGAEANIRAASANYDEKQYQLAQRTQLSQLNGLVYEVYYHQGEYVPTTAPVLAIRLTDQDKVRFHVPQEQMTQVQLGQTIQVNADGLATPVSAKVTYIASTAEFTPPVIYSKDSRAKLVFLVEATLPANHDLKPGLPVDITL